MSIVHSYFKERFPLIPVLLFSVGYAALVLGVTSPDYFWSFHTYESLNRLLLISNIFFFFLLRQRATDEFRDAVHDKMHFPDRPVPRGLISKEKILLLGLFAFSVEVVSAFLLSPADFMMYIPVLFYSLLMAYKFFSRSWLDTHFTVDFIVHEVIFILFGFYFISALHPQGVELTVYSLVSLVALTTAPISIEIMRKFNPRHDKKGKVVEDTYSTVWGRNVALTALVYGSFITAVCLSYLKASPIYIVTVGILLVLWCTVMYRSKHVAIVAAISFLLQSLLVNIL